MSKSIQYNVPFKLHENFSDSTGDFVIKGIAISSVTTDNGHLFKPDELRNSAGSLANRPLLMDHDASIKSMIGRVVSSIFDETEQVIRFEAKINDTEAGKIVKQLILAGDLGTVSVGCNVQDILEEDGIFIPIGVKFKELSVVATPADDNAQFTKMNMQLILKEAYNSKSNTNVKQNGVAVDLKIKKEINMEKENSVLETLKEENDKFKAEVNAKIEAQATLLADTLSKVDSMKESMESDAKAKDEVNTKIEASLDSIKSLIAELTKESDKDESEKSEESKEESKEETKEESKEESKEEKEDEDEESDEDNTTVGEQFKIVQGHRSFTVVKDKY